MTSRDHLSFGVEPSDYQIRPESSFSVRRNIFQFEGNSRSDRRQAPSILHAQKKVGEKQGLH